MKKQLLIKLIFLVTCFSCSEDNSTNPAPEPTPEGGSFFTSHSEGVYDWSYHNDTINRYYTLIDTFSHNNIYPSLLVKYFEKSGAEVSWYVNGKSLEDSLVSRKWDGDINVWFEDHSTKGYQPLSVGDKLSAKVSFETGNTINLNTVISEKRYNTDILYYNFGTSYSEIQSIASVNLNETWNNPHPNFYIDREGVSHAYVFENDKLTSFIMLERSYRYSLDSILNYSAKLGLTTPPQFSSDGELLGTYTWTNGKINFTLKNIEQIKEYTKENHIGLVFSKVSN